MKKIVVLLGILLIIAVSAYAEPYNRETLINEAHLNALYEEITIEDGKVLGVVHIYCTYPDYQWVDAPDEGMTCVDDIARAGLFYVKHYQLTQNEESLKKLYPLVEYVLHLQAENGYFHNFIFSNYEINTTHPGSVATINWWTGRALWFLIEVEDLMKEHAPELAKRIEESVVKALAAIKQDMPQTGETIEQEEGIAYAAWIPYSAADLTSLFLLSSALYYQKTGDETLKEDAESLARGILVMQKGDPTTFPYGAFLSWKNVWHAWGNNQAYALLKAGQILNNQEMIDHALTEVDYFYPYLLQENFLREMAFLKEQGEIKVKATVKFPQIAYDIRPMVYASLEAYNITKEEKYVIQAAELATWYFGNNPANAQMYFPETGRCFDGIDGVEEEQVNKDSGAESTIEALLVLVAIEKNDIAKKQLWDYYKNTQQ